MIRTTVSLLIIASLIATSCGSDDTDSSADDSNTRTADPTTPTEVEATDPQVTNAPDTVPQTDPLATTASDTVPPTDPVAPDSTASTSSPTKASIDRKLESSSWSGQLPKFIASGSAHSLVELSQHSHGASTSPTATSWLARTCTGEKHSKAAPQHGFRASWERAAWSGRIRVLPARSTRRQTRMGVDDPCSSMYSKSFCWTSRAVWYSNGRKCRATQSPSKMPSDLAMNARS